MSTALVTWCVRAIGASYPPDQRDDALSQAHAYLEWLDTLPLVTERNA